MDVRERTNDEVRAHVHGMWSGVASRWAEHAAYVDERAAELTDRLLDAARLRPGDRVLELACGPGGAGLGAAGRVGPEGEVVLSDVVPEMTSIAVSRARARGVDNVRGATLDLEDIDEPDGTYDAVLCRDGLMFAVEPERATGEMHRVLRDGGRLALAVWGHRKDNPWLGVVLDAVGAVTGSPVPPPGIPGPFALGDALRVEDLLLDAGFSGVAVEGVAVPLRAPSFEAWWTRTAAIAGPIAAVVARLGPDARVALEDRLRAAVAPDPASSGIELPGLALLACGHKA